MVSIYARWAVHVTVRSTLSMSTLYTHSIKLVWACLTYLSLWRAHQSGNNGGERSPSQDRQETRTLTWTSDLNGHLVRVLNMGVDDLLRIQIPTITRVQRRLIRHGGIPTQWDARGCTTIQLQGPQGFDDHWHEPSTGLNFMIRHPQRNRRF